MSSHQERRAISFARYKAAREGRDIAVYRLSDTLFELQPTELRTTDDEEPYDVITADTVDESTARAEIDDHSTIAKGDHVIVGGDPERVVRVTKLLLETESGARFLRSDGTGYGDESRAVTRALADVDEHHTL